MSGVSKKTINMTLLPSSDMKSKTSSKNETIQCWNNSFSRGTSGSTRSYLYNPFFNKAREAKMSATPILLKNYMNSNKTLLPISNNDPLNTVTESKKRNRSKSGPASRKRSKKKQLDETSNEKSLNTDLIALVETFNTDKNLDSNSSTDTIISDSEDNIKSCNNNKITTQTNKITNTFLTDNRTLSLDSNIALKHNAASQQNKKFKNSTQCLNNSSLTQNAFTHNSSVLKDYLSKGIPNIHPASNSFKFCSNLGPVSTISSSSVSKTKAKKSMTKLQQKPSMYDSKDPLNKIFSGSNCNINLPHSNAVEQPAKSFQSIYASMGLDEDLCDVKSHKAEENLNSKFVSGSSSANTKEINSQNSVQNFCNIPIKIEKDTTPPTSPGNGESKICRDIFDESRNSSNKMHIDMTFEADPYDEEDDLPLSILKSKVDDTSETSNKCDDANATTNQSTLGNIPILFIKKELIEDEIVSESPEISSKNILSSQSSNFASKVNLSSSLKTTEDMLNLNSVSNFNSEVKIKLEPVTDFEYSDSCKTICRETLPQNFSDLPAESSNVIVPENSNLSKKGKKDKQKKTKKKVNPKPIISPLSSNVDVPSTSYNAHETLNEETATTKVVSKKKKVRKTPKRNKNTVQLEANYNLNSESFQNADSGKSSVLDTNSSADSLDISYTTLDVNSNITNTENMATSKKKGKKNKIVKESVHLDENLPITLLIKRQKTADANTDGLDSFLCTNISKSVIDEVEKDSITENLSDQPLHSSSCNYLKGSDLLNSKEPLIKNLDNLSSNFQNSPKKKKKNQPKKKPVKKRNQLGKFKASQISHEQDNNEQSNNLLIINDNKVCESPYDTNVCNSSNINKETSGDHKGQDSTVVHMSFEEQHSPPDDCSEEFVNSILSVKEESGKHLYPDSTVHSRLDSTGILPAIKKENDSILESEACELSKSTVSVEQNSQLSTPVSGFSSELSHLNVNDVSDSLNEKDATDSPSKSEKTESASKKKKKGKKKSYGWYKKKKPRTKRTNQPIADTSFSDTDFSQSTSAPISDTEFYTSVAGPLSDTNIYSSSTKQPVVVVKNLLPDIEKVVASHEKDKECLNVESETILLPTKNKKNNSGKASKRKSAVSSKKSSNKKLLLEVFESENNSFETSKKTADPAIQSPTYKNMVLTSIQLPISKNLVDPPIQSPTKNSVDSPIQSPNSEKNCLKNIPWADMNTKSVITRSASEETVYAPFDDLPDCNQENEIIDISDSPVKTSDKSQPGEKWLHSPLINVAEIAQEIAGLENLVHSYNKHRHGTLNNIISNSSERSTHECTSKTSEIAAIRNQSTASLCDLNIKNSIDFSRSPSELQNISLIEPLAKIKKEPDAYGTYEANIDSDLHNLSSIYDTSNTRLSDLNSISNKAQISDNSVLINSSFIKTETSDSVSCSRLLSQNLNKATNTFDNNHSSKSSKNSESFHLKLFEPSDKIALSIKKEVSSAVCGSSINSIRSQNELLNSVSKIHSESVTNNLNINNASSKQKLDPASSQALHLKTYVTGVQNNAKIMTDEIQILEVDAQKAKNVPCVDLTDDVSNVNSSVEKNNSFASSNKHIPELCDNKAIIHGNIISEKVLHAATSKETNFSAAENKKDMVSNEQNSELIKLPSEKNIFQSSFSDDDLYTSNEKETIDPFILRQKYINEYFRYPFPPSVASFHSKPQKKHKTYTRIHSQTLNLSIEKVESRLKNSDNSKLRFGNKLGDIVKLDRFPVSSSEVECYHRILGIAPSHKLLSKCFKSPDNKASSVLDEFNLLPEFQGQSSISNFESKNPSIICSLQDVIQGISESRMMCEKSDVQTSSDVYKRDCPSIDTKDSCDSFTSSVSDRFANSVQKNDIKIKNSLLKDSDLINSSQDASSSGRNSALSCAASDFQDSVKNDSALESFSSSRNSAPQELSAQSSDINESSISQNILRYLTLPSKEELASLVNNESNKSLTDMETHEERTSTAVVLEKEPVLSNNLHSLPNSNEQVMSAPPSAGSSNICSNISEDGNILQKIISPVLNIDVPVTELRKILEVAGSFCPGSNSNEVNLWKSKETFEYNHTRSVPITAIKSDQKFESTTLSLPNSSVATVEDKSSRDNVKKDDSVPEHSDDDDYVDNEPQYCESDVDKNETSNLNDKEQEEPQIPQYKSKWEKIMERKSLENKQKKQINEHLLKDCFPVSSKVPSKKCNVPNKTSGISATAKKSDSKKTESHDTKRTKSVRKAKTKSHQKPLATEKARSKLISKKKEDTVSNKIESKSKEYKKESKSSPKKKKGKYADDVTNLFVPDKPVKATEKESGNKSSDSNPAKCFYGNRITNRGTFLTESSSEVLKKIKIPKKKIDEISKKPVNVRSEEFHSMVKSPVINLEPRHGSRYHDRTNLIVVKSNNYRIHKKNKYFDRDPPRNNSSILLNLPESGNLQNNKRTFADTQPSDLFHPAYRASFPNRNVSFLSNPLPEEANDVNNRNAPLLNAQFHTKDESSPYRKIPLLNTSIAYPSNDTNFSSTKVPYMNIPPSTSKEFPPSKNILSNTSPPLALLQNIISNAKSNSSVAPVEATLPFSGYLNPAWNNGQYPSTPGQPYFSDMSDSMSDSVLITPSSVTDLPSVDCNFVSGPLESSFQVHNQPNHSFDSANINSQFIPSLGSGQISHPTKKALSICLVPQDLKSLVGHKTIETSNVRLLMLEWSVDWLFQQQKIHDPPPIYAALKKVGSSYDNFEEYYNTYFPLMLLDTWHRIYVSWTHLSQASPYFCEISSYSVKSNFVSVECQTVFNSTDHPKSLFPDEGSILMIKYGTKLNEFAIKILGYVTCVKTRRFNHVTDSKLCNFKQPKDGNFESLNVLTLTFIGAYNSEDIDKRLPIRIHVLCNVRSTLKQNDALLYISKSPLQRSILNPVEDGLLSFSLTPRNSPQDKINECVRDITKGILSPHPLPLLTVVRAVPESDRLNIIPLLIEKMKTGYKTKVLLCVRTVRALSDIAANICLRESLKMVIINKRCDTGVQFQKYILDELVASEINKLEGGSSEKHLAKNEVVIRTKKQIFSECDVILSLIRNSHDEFMETTFAETESIAQMCCIVDEANLCTEPETLIPVLHGISKLILIGDPDYPAKVVSKTAKEYDYNRSFFHRAYDLDLITE